MPGNNENKEERIIELYLERVGVYACLLFREISAGYREIVSFLYRK